MTTNEELLDLKKKFRKLTPDTNPASEYNTTLAKIKAAEAKRETARKSAAEKLAEEKSKKDAAKASKERTRDLATIKYLENEIKRQTIYLNIRKFYSIIDEIEQNKINIK